ncbi:MAG: T9SS type A sorting domain-containing protein [Chitinophagales bacterium]
MKHLLIFLFATCLSVNLFSQNFTYFNKKLQLPSTNLVVVATLPLSNAYLVLGNYTNLEGRVVFIAKMDIYGDLIWIHSLEVALELGTDGGSATGTCLVQIDENNFAATYGIYKDITFEDIDIALVKFTVDGEITWKRTYGMVGENRERAYHLLHTKDNGFLLTGFRDIERFHFYIIKTDSEGEAEWEKTYSLGGTSVAFHANETLDGGYIFSGYGKSPITDFDMYCVKTNDKGQLQWQKNYGTENSDLGGQVVPLNSDEYILWGGINESDDVRKTYIAKLNTIGNIIWERKHQLPSISTSQTKIIIKPDNGFIGVAVYENEYGTYQPIIMNFDSRGDTLWTKTITADPNASVYIRDIEKIEGGYVLAGHRFFPTPQYGWILTIDEEGNTCSEGRTYAEADFEGCDSTVVVTDIPHFPTSSSYQVQIAPNPARQQTTIHYQIPKEGVLKVYDYQGRLMDSWELKMNNSSLTLEIGDWTSGVYLYQLEIGGERIEGGKFIVE